MGHSEKNFHDVEASELKLIGSKLRASTMLCNIFKVIFKIKNFAQIQGAISQGEGKNNNNNNTSSQHKMSEELRTKKEEKNKILFEDQQKLLS